MGVFTSCREYSHYTAKYKAVLVKLFALVKNEEKQDNTIECTALAPRSCSLHDQGKQLQ